ncbi:hypothetical protein PaecuDRAFT_1811 [Paenibacillus curdlanolyticus YK9]|uniref:Butirosin biosynthesis protein H N-terminal domain-containing protein n=1 Tax=Paenibacillus curdlanolyticus YK9 TaxID=717606 RepID=E0I860_9BACL|nr:hypothetical protein [Paenibacillus curdlanolyticus]EFM11365.1 hypothetical protein PaecuDRAFT_1811 [Paenibacillus curdlanolyticus YK9]
MRKILPMIMPEITSFQHYTAILSIIDNDDRIQEWKFTHFFQLFALVNDYNENGKHIPYVDFYSTTYILKSTPWVNVQTVTMHELNQQDIIDYVIASIDAEQYVYISVECQHIVAHNKPDESFPHPIIIFGYDREQQVVHIADFFNSAYSFKEASFQELRTAYETYVEGSFWWDGAQVLALNDNEPKVSIDSAFYKSLLSDYLHSTTQAPYVLDYGSDLIHHTKTVPSVYSTKYGMSIYDELIANFGGRGPVDYTVLPVLTDHKRNLYQFIEYMKTKGVLPSDYPDYCEILNKTKATRNTFLKGVLRGDDRYYKQIADNLAEIRDLERRAIADLIEAL